MNFLKELIFKTIKYNSGPSKKDDTGLNSTNNTSILFNVLWAFDKKEYNSKEEFSKEVKLYQINISGKDTWKPKEIVLDKPEIALLLDMIWEEPPNDKVEIILKSENNKNFTALDLMFQINNFVAKYDLEDFRFFEGLDKDYKSNLYHINLGS